MNGIDQKTLHQLKQLYHPTRTTAHQISMLAQIIGQASEDAIMQNHKIIARLVCFYLKGQPGQHQTQQLMHQLLTNISKKIKNMPKVIPPQLTYLLHKLTTSSNYNSSTVPVPQPPPQLPATPPKPSLTYLNYSKQQSQNPPQIDKQIDSLCTQIAENQLQLPNPNCIGCSEYYYGGQYGEYGAFGGNGGYCTMWEGTRVDATGQFCVAIGEYIKNSVFQEDLGRAMVVSLNQGGGYILITNENGPFLTGIPTDNTLISNLYQKITQSLKSLKPDPPNYSISIKFLKVCPNIFSKSPPPSSPTPQKFILKIRLKPLTRRTFYIQHRIRSNKSVFKFYWKVRDRILQVYQEDLYRGIYLRYYQGDWGVGGCLGCGVGLMRQTAHQPTHIQDNSTTHNNTIISINPNINNKTTNNSISIPIPKNTPTNPFNPLNSSTNPTKHEVFIDMYEQSDQPIMKYKNYAVIVISSGKYEKPFIDTLRQQLQTRKILSTLNKPFSKHAGLSQRIIYFLSHQCEFNFINTIIKSADSNNKTRAIIVTKFLQIKDFVEKEKRLRMKTAIKQIFDAQFQYEERFEKVETTSKIVKEVLFYYYGFYEERHAVFAFVYLDNLGERCQFVKEYHFKHQHKIKK